MISVDKSTVVEKVKFFTIKASPPPSWHLADGEGASVSQGLRELYRQGFKLLAGLTKLERSRRRGQTIPSRLGMWLIPPHRKNKHCYGN